jgi:hypothetical protein
MTAAAWRQLHRHWKPRLTPQLLWQRGVAGPLFSLMNSYQSALCAKSRDAASLAGSIVILGYWRSGTTLLHNYLAHDCRFGFPSTYACMHPQHFILTQGAALKRRQTAIRRPMDDVTIQASSPQEDEFGLLALGARSPYEALLCPSRLADALRLSDPRDLPPDQEQHWRDTFSEFLHGVSLVEGNRPLILKSPPHGYRVATLRQLLPDARFVLIVRSPHQVFESSIRMWRSLFGVYAVDAVPPEDDTRRDVLADRPRFEAKLAAGLRGLPSSRNAIVHYESLVKDPLGSIGRLYEQLELDNFAAVEKGMKTALASVERYEARNALPSEHWQRQVRDKWRSVFETYRYT